MSLLTIPNGGATSKDSPLSILAAVSSPNPEPIEAKVISLGTDIDGIPFELFHFPSGHFYALEHLSRLLFRDNGAKILSLLSYEQLGTALVQDIQMKIIYIAAESLKNIANSSSKTLSLLANLTVSGLLSGQQKVAPFEGLNILPTESLAESFMKSFISPYRLERRNSKQLKRPPPSSIETLKSKEKKKRLSIETKFTETLESNTVSVEQLKSSYLLKQKQQAIIDSRSRSAHPDNPPSSLPKIGKIRFGSIDLLESPIPGEASKKPFDQLSSGSINFNHSKGIPSPIVRSKDEFMRACELFYDGHESTEMLRNVLREQIRKSANLLYTLSSSAQMIESLVKTHFKENQKLHNDRMNLTVEDFNMRLGKLEKEIFGNVETNSFTPSATPKVDSDTSVLETIKEKEI